VTRTASSSGAGLRRGLCGALLVGWVLIILGALGEWVGHGSAALSLSGPDLSELVKFLPAMRDGSLHVHRLVFYAPAVAAALGVSLLSRSPLRFPVWARSLGLLLGMLLTLQLLPPAWSPASLQTDEFRVQTTILLLCWFLLACSWLVGRAPLPLTGSLAGLLALVAGALSVWQTRLIMPHLATIYGAPIALGWGFWAAGLGLAATFLASTAIACSAARGRLQP
jgi:hypothetical protein